MPRRPKRARSGPKGSKRTCGSLNTTKLTKALRDDLSLRWLANRKTSPKGIGKIFVRDACLSIDPALPPATSLREDVQTFIRKHGPSTVPLRK